MAARHPVTREVTRADIEMMLDRLAEEIAARGSDGERLLPLYRRIEQEGARMDRDAETMATALARAKRLKG